MTRSTDTFIRVEQSFRRHPRVFAFAADLGVHPQRGRSIIEDLWWVAKDMGPLLTMPNEAIARLLDWEGEPDELIEALLAHDWLRRAGHGRDKLEVCGWAERYSKLENQRKYERERKAKQRAERDKQRCPDDVPVDVPPKSEGEEEKKIRIEEEQRATAEQGSDPEPLQLTPPAPSEPSGPPLDHRVFRGKISSLQLTRVQVDKLKVSFGAAFVEAKLNRLAEWTEDNPRKRKHWRKREQLFAWVRGRVSADHETTEADASQRLRPVPEFPDVRDTWDDDEDHAA